MADQSITQLPVAISVTGDEQTVIVQRGVTKQVQVSLIANAVSPGKLITNVILDAQNYLVFYYSDGTTSSTGPIPGYINATINGSGHLILTLTTGGTVDCGNVVGPTGPGVATGGTTGQVLTKTSNADYATGWTTPTTGTVTSVSATAGTGISITGSPITSSGTLNITNTAPDQTVVLTAGTGIGVTGTYPNFTIANTSPSSGGTVTSVTGTAPVVSSGGNTPVISMAKATSSVDGYLSATDWNTFNSKGSGSVTSVSATAGTGISVTGSPITSSGTLNITNTAPDQTVVLTAGTGISTSGTYPNFTITNTNPSSGGTVTSVASGTGLTGGPITTTGTLSIANTGVTAGTYGSAAVIPVIAVNSQGQITSISTQPTNAPAYQGTWNASTNTPTLVSSVGTAGYYYVVSVAGNTSLNGVTGWAVGDWAIFENGVWQKIAGSSSESFTNLTTTNLAVTGLTGYMYANNTTGNVTASTTIPNAGLANSAITINGTSTSLGGSINVGTVTSVSATVPSFLSVSGSPITTSGTLALTYSGTALPVANGGTGVTTSTGSGSNVLNTSPTLTTPAITGGTISNLTQELIGQSYDQGTGVLQVTGQSTFNGAVTDKSLNLQGGNNYFKSSQTFNNANWTKRGTCTTTDNQIVAPDGTTTGCLIAGLNGTGNDIYNTSYQTDIAAANGTLYTPSFWIQRVSTTGTISLGAPAGPTYGSWTINLATIGSGWVKITPTTTGVTVINSFSVFNNNSGIFLNANSGGPLSFYIWGAQEELGTVASAYTPTTTAAITTTNNISVPSGQVLAQGGSVSLPAIGLGATNTGIYGTAASVAFSIGGVATTSINAQGIYTATPIQFTSAFGNASDAFIYRDAANILAQRNSTNAQTFRLYNTYTSTSLGEWLSVDWSTTANTATIATKANGAGVVRTLATGNPLVISTGYTVATLPTGVVGMRAYVTNALAPAYGVAVAGGGAVTIPVFYNGTAWICA